MKLCIVVGTRPEIIKMAPVIRECQKRKIPFFILHSGQHYSYNMDKEFFEELELPQPKINLGIGSQPYKKQVALMVKEMKKALEKERPDVVIVQGDTTTVLAAALAGTKLGIKVAHHEAGLRSNDLRMIEETNRIITDQISDYLFTPTKDATQNLIEEGKNNAVQTGNTIVDAVIQNSKLADKKSKILKQLNLKPRDYILVTAHRAENVDDKERLQGIAQGLDMVQKELKKIIVFPIHPRTKKQLETFKIKLSSQIKVIEPVGFLDMLQLEKNSVLIITDSGGIQEEACVLKIPTVTIRDNTERPETIEGGMNELAGTNPHKIFETSKKMITKKIKWTNPFGDGKAAERIIDYLLKNP